MYDSLLKKLGTLDKSEELQQMVRAFREAQRPTCAEAVFSHEILPFPCLFDKDVEEPTNADQDNMQDDVGSCVDRVSPVTPQNGKEAVQDENAQEPTDADQNAEDEGGTGYGKQGEEQDVSGTEDDNETEAEDGSTESEGDSEAMDALTLRRRTTREQRLQLSEKQEAALQVRRQELLQCLATVCAFGYPYIVELVAHYAISPTTAVRVSGLGMDVSSMGQRHIATLVQELQDKINSRDARCQLPVLRYTCNGCDIEVNLLLNPYLTLGDLSKGASVTEFVRHLRHHPPSAVYLTATVHQ